MSLGCTVELRLKQRGTEHLNWRGQKKKKNPHILKRCLNVTNSETPLYQLALSRELSCVIEEKQEPVTSCTDGSQMCECATRGCTKGSQILFALVILRYIVMAYLFLRRKKNIKAIQVSYIKFCGSLFAQDMYIECIKPSLRWVHTARGSGAELNLLPFGALWCSSHHKRKRRGNENASI